VNEKKLLDMTNSYLFLFTVFVDIVFNAAFQKNAGTIKIDIRMNTTQKMAERPMHTLTTPVPSSVDGVGSGGLSLEEVSGGASIRYYYYDKREIR
jgi:hypothetical protein